MPFALIPRRLHADCSAMAPDEEVRAAVLELARVVGAESEVCPEVTRVGVGGSSGAERVDDTKCARQDARSVQRVTDCIEPLPPAPDVCGADEAAEVLYEPKGGVLVVSARRQK